MFENFFADPDSKHVDSAFAGDCCSRVNTQRSFGRDEVAFKKVIGIGASFIVFIDHAFNRDPDADRYLVPEQRVAFTIPRHAAGIMLLQDNQQCHHVLAAPEVIPSSRSKWFMDDVPVWRRFFQCSQFHNPLHSSSPLSYLQRFSSENH